MESSGSPSSIHGAMSALGRSIDCGGFDKADVEGLVPTVFLFSCPWSKREPLIASTGVASSGESEKNVPLLAWDAVLRAALGHTRSVSIQAQIDVRTLEGGNMGRVRALPLIRRDAAWCNTC